MSCWTLWQRMPSRYQLTMRNIRTDDPETPRGKDTHKSSRASSASPRGCKLRTPRGSQRVGSASARLTGDVVMLTSRPAVDGEGDASPDAAAATATAAKTTADEIGRQSPSLPPRSSAYIHNMKNTMRINSAKRKIDEGIFVPTAAGAHSSSKSESNTVSYSPKARANTAPPFPITKPSNADEYHRASSPVSQHPPEQHTPRNHHQRMVSNSPRHHQEAVSSGSPRHYLQGVGCSPRQHHPGGNSSTTCSSRHKGHQNKQHPQRGFSGRLSPRRPSSGYATGDSRRVAVSTISPFSEMTQFRAEGQRPLIHHQRSSGDRLQQDIVIGECQVATLYVDKDRVTFFRKTRPDLTQSVYSAISPYQVSKDDGSYLSHLRKAYLSGVRDLPKTCHRSEPDMENHTTIRQRIDYNKKVGKILDYYAQVDISKTIHSPRPLVSSTQLSQTSFVNNPLRSGFKTIGFRRRSGPRSSFEAIDDAGEGMEYHSPRNQPRHHHPHGRRGSAPLNRERLQETVEEEEEGEEENCVPPIGVGGFVRINSKARLHDRQHFYLRTPGVGGPAGQSENGADPCVCRMCKLEMDVALMAQLHKDLGMTVDAATAAHIRATLEAKDGGVEVLNTGHAAPAEASSNAPHNLTNYADIQTSAGLDAIEEAPFCPTRPNSASDTAKRLPGDLVECPPFASDSSANRKSESVGQDKGRPERNKATNTQVSSVNESTSLTVTMPAVEEAGERSDARSTKSDVADITDVKNEVANSPSTSASTTDAQHKSTESSEGKERLDSTIINANADTLSKDVNDNMNDKKQSTSDLNQDSVLSVNKDTVKIAEESDQTDQALEHSNVKDEIHTQKIISEQSNSYMVQTQQDNPEYTEPEEGQNRETPKREGVNSTANSLMVEMDASIQAANKATMEEKPESTPPTAPSENGMAVGTTKDKEQTQDKDKIENNNYRHSETTATALTTTMNTVNNDNISPKDNNSP